MLGRCLGGYEVGCQECGGVECGSVKEVCGWRVQRGREPGVDCGREGCGCRARESGGEGLGARVTGQWLMISSIFGRQNVPENHGEVFFSEEQCTDVEILNKVAYGTTMKHYPADHRVRFGAR